MKKYNVAMQVWAYERIYDIEAENEAEAFKIAKNESVFRGEGAQYTLDEIDEIGVISAPNLKQI